MSAMPSTIRARFLTMMLVCLRITGIRTSRNKAVTANQSATPPTVPASNADAVTTQNGPRIHPW